MTENRCINCMRKRTDSGGACPHCGFDPGKYKPPEQTLPPGTTLNHGKYIIGRVLGRGGFGVTYVALDTTLDLRVAVKECIPRNCAWRNKSGDAVQWGLSVPEQEMMLESFVKEARKMAKIDQIPGVVRVREYFYDNETAYIVMDYVEGETLAQYLRRNGPLNAEACFRVLAPAMDSLAQAHKRGLIHRDISPNNIMIETNGERVWVLDLGAAKDLGTRISAPNVSMNTRIVGTPGYTPLEQYDPNGAIGPWTDVYAMSATFFRCMTGQKLPPSTSRALKDDAPELLRTIRGPVGAVLEKGLAQNPDERYQSMSELRDALEKAIRQKKSKAPKPKTAKKEAPEEKSTSQPQTSKDNSSVSKAVLIMIASLIVLIAVFTLIPFSLKMASSKPVTALESENTAPTDTVTEIQAEPLTGVIASGKCGENASWALDENYLLTISGTGSMTDYSYYESYPVDTPWLEYQETISNIKILQGITYIGANAFKKCVNLENVEISDSVTTIGADSFYSCTSLTTVTIPKSVTAIENGAFGKCTHLKSILIPDSVVEIGATVFRDCASLTDVTIPDSVTSIGDAIFYGCTGLISVTLPSNMIKISRATFQGCENLTNIKIPDTVTEIGNSVFYYCMRLSDITIPDSVTTIGSYAFYSCTGLTNITIPDSVTTIDSNAFARCTSLTNITIPDSVTELGENAFAHCENATSIILSNNLTEIQEGTFDTCASVAHIVIPDGVTSIGRGAFHDCASLFTVTIPDSVTTIEKMAFRGCVSLPSVTIPENASFYKNGDFEDSFSDNTVVTRR